MNHQSPQRAVLWLAVAEDDFPNCFISSLSPHCHPRTKTPNNPNMGDWGTPPTNGGLRVVTAAFLIVVALILSEGAAAETDTCGPTEYISGFKVTAAGKVEIACMDIPALTVPPRVYEVVNLTWRVPSLGPEVTAVGGNTTAADPVTSILQNVVFCPVRTNMTFAMTRVSVDFYHEQTRAPLNTCDELRRDDVPIVAVVSYRCVQISSAPLKFPLVPAIIRGRYDEAVRCPTFSTPVGRILSRCGTDPSAYPVVMVCVGQSEADSLLTTTTGAPEVASAVPRNYTLSIRANPNSSNNFIASNSITASMSKGLASLYNITTESGGGNANATWLSSDLFMYRRTESVSLLRIIALVEIFSVMAATYNKTNPVKNSAVEEIGCCLVWVPYTNVTVKADVAAAVNDDIPPLFIGLSVYVAVVTGLTGVAVFVHHRREVQAAEAATAEAKQKRSGLEDRRIIVNATGLTFQEDVVVDNSGRRGGPTGGAGRTGTGASGADDDELEYGEVPYTDVMLEWNAEDNILGLVPVPSTAGSYDLPASLGPLLPRRRDLDTHATAQRNASGGSAVEMEVMASSASSNLGSAKGQTAAAESTTSVGDSTSGASDDPRGGKPPQKGGHDSGSVEAVAANFSDDDDDLGRAQEDLDDDDDGDLDDDDSYTMSLGSEDFDEDDLLEDEEGGGGTAAADGGAVPAAAAS